MEVRFCLPKSKRVLSMQSFYLNRGAYTRILGTINYTRLDAIMRDAERGNEAVNHPGHRLDIADRDGDVGDNENRLNDWMVANYIWIWGSAGVVIVFFALRERFK